MKTLEEQLANKCVNFNGIMNDACKAGVKYDDVRISMEIIPEGGTETRTVKRLPCFMDEAREGGCTCSKRHFRTADEIAVAVADRHRRIADIGAARSAITADAGPYKRGEGKSGRIPCPVCTVGSLAYSRAGINGHVHARCSTTGCVSWME